MALKFKIGDEVRVLPLEELKKLYSSRYHPLRESMERAAGTTGIITEVYGDDVYHINDNSDYWYASALTLSKGVDPWKT